MARDMLAHLGVTLADLADAEHAAADLSLGSPALGARPDSRYRPCTPISPRPRGRRARREPHLRQLLANHVAFKISFARRGSPFIRLSRLNSADSSVVCVPWDGARPAARPGLGRRTDRRRVHSCGSASHRRARRPAPSAARQLSGI
jgi:hypothetical protein